MIESRHGCLSSILSGKIPVTPFLGDLHCLLRSCSVTLTSIKRCLRHSPSSNTDRGSMSCSHHNQCADRRRVRSLVSPRLHAFQLWTFADLHRDRLRRKATIPHRFLVSPLSSSSRPSNSVRRRRCTTVELHSDVFRSSLHAGGWVEEASRANCRIAFGTFTYNFSLKCFTVCSRCALTTLAEMN